MHPSDSRIADLLPRIVERAARRSDEQKEEPWVKPQKSAPAADSQPTAGKMPAGATMILLALLVFPAFMAFALTSLAGTRHYPMVGPPNNEQLTCTGAPLVHTITSNHLGMHRQFYAGALAINGLMWLAVALSVCWSLRAGVSAYLAFWAGGKRRFTIGQLLAISVGIAMTFAAWRWDLLADVPWQSTVEQMQKSFERGEPAGPAFQPMFRFSFMAAGYAYLGVGCAGLCLVSGGLWVIRQFLPRQPGEDKSLLQQIF